MIAFAAALVLALTLFPAEPMGTSRPFDCLVCGQRGWADALLNLGLFFPLGATIAFARGTLLGALGVAAALSGSVEAAQLFIPGRDASVGDLLFNTTGAAIGVVIVRSAPLWLAPGPRAASLLSMVAVLVAASVIASTGWLLRSAPPLSTYFVQWTPELRHLETYDGRIHASSLDGRPLAPGGPLDSSWAAEQLERGAPLRITGLGGSGTNGLSALFAIQDDLHQEVVLVGADQDDLVFRYRTRAAAMRLDQPDLRLSGAARMLRPGEPFELTFAREGDYLCAWIGSERHCRLGFGAGAGWSLLLYEGSWPEWTKRFFGLAWLAVLFLPVGYYAGPHVASLAAAALALTAILVIPPAVGLLPSSLPELMAAAAGGLLGWGLGATRRSH